MTYQTKKNLILSAAIVGCVYSVFSVIAFILLGIMTPIMISEFQRLELFYLADMYASLIPFLGILMIIFGLGSIIPTVFCFIVQKCPAGEFSKKNGLYISAVVLSIVFGNLISFILLIISLSAGEEEISGATVQIETEKEEKKEQNNETYYFEERLNKLKQLKASGALTEEEYKAVMIKEWEKGFFKK